MTEKPKTKKLILPLTLVAILTIFAGYFFYSKKISVELPEGKAASLVLDDNGSNDLSSTSFGTSCGGGTMTGIEACGVPAIYKIKEKQGSSSYWTKGTINLDSAQNESESFQMVVRSNSNLNNLKLKLNPLVNATGNKIAISNIRVYEENWVNINAPQVTVDKDGKTVPVDPNVPANPANFQPDPLFPINPNNSNIANYNFNLTAGKNKIFWITITVPTGTIAGTYKGDINVQDNKSANKTSMAVSFNVRNFTLPKRPILKSMVEFDGATGVDTKSVYDYHGAGAQDTNNKDTVTRLYYDEFSRARLSPFLYAPAFNMLTEEKGYIKWSYTKGADQKYNGVTIDFSKFDNEAKNYFNIKKTFSTFNVMRYLWDTAPNGMPYLKFDDYNGVNRIVSDDDNWKNIPAGSRPSGSYTVVSSAEYDAVVTSYFKQVANYLNTKGWLDRAVYYVEDEPDLPTVKRVNTMKKIAQLVRYADPNIHIKTVAVISDPASFYGLYDSGTKKYLLNDLVDSSGNSLIDIWVPYYTNYPANKATYFPTKGTSFWNYDVSIKALISQSGTDNRSIFWDVWKRNATGYLYYETTLWGPNPWQYTNFKTVWGDATNGNGNFFYPPKKDGSTPSSPITNYITPSIRWELMREGVEDYDYFKTLQNLIITAKKNSGYTDQSPLIIQANNALDAARGIGGTMSEYRVRDFTLPQTLPSGWWLAGGADKTALVGDYANISIGITVPTTGLPDGDYDLIVRVHNTGINPTSDEITNMGKARRSKFKINDSATTYQSNTPWSVWQEEVSAGKVTIKNNKCSFKLTAVVDASTTKNPFGGVMLYKVGFKKPEIPGGLYAARQQVATAIETLKTALKPPMDSDGAIIEN